MKVYILSEDTYAAMMEKSTPSRRLLMESARENGQIIVSPYLPDGEKGYIFDAWSLMDSGRELPDWLS